MFLRTYFNSHPHEEDDVASFSSFVHVCISTHILTKRMTFVTVVVEFFHGYISTHILTKRMTCKKRIKLLRLDISTHILTKRMTGIYAGGWLLFIISTHILTKRMTAILNKNNLFKIAYYINNKHFISIVDIFFHFHIYF